MSHSRIAFALGVIILLLTIVLAIYYYQFLRPLWNTPAIMSAIARVLADPSTPAEQVRMLAKTEYSALRAAYQAQDATIELFLSLSGFASVGFLYIGFRIARARRETSETAL